MNRQIRVKEAKALLEQHRLLNNQLIEQCYFAEKQRAEAVTLISELMGKGVFSDYVISSLATDNLQTPLSSDIRMMIYSLFKYLRGISLSSKSKQHYQIYLPHIKQNVSYLKPATNGLHWFFTSKQTKARASAAYDYLFDSSKGVYAQQISSANQEIEQLKLKDYGYALEDFTNNRLSYETVVREILSKEIHDELEIPELVHLTDIHQKILNQMSSVENSIALIKDNIKKSVERLIAVDVLNRLKEIPVDELARDKTGVRIKPLRDSGYQTVSDVYCASVSSLASVQGISETSAQYFKREASNYLNRLKAGTKIRLSVDNKSDETTALIVALYEYRLREGQIRIFEEFRRSQCANVSRDLQRVRSVGNGVMWLFLEYAEKVRVHSSYQYLTDLLKGDYSQSISKLASSFGLPFGIDPVQAWRDFEQNSILYFNIIEDIIPGVLGNDDGLYGLPEDLAREIQEECFFPDGLLCDLRRYQEWGVKYILHQERVLLGDEMGLGKTIQAIASMVSLRNTGATHFVVVCPASVLSNWCKEISVKSKLRVTKIHGTTKLSAYNDWLRTGGVAVTTFETTSHLKMDNNYKYDMLVVDEAHYIKNPDAKRTQNVKELGSHANRILFMTGTALENRVDEMISLIHILRPNLASQLHEISFLSSAPEFRKKVAPVYYRRKREDVLTELPELIDNNEWCMLSPEEEFVYENTILAKQYVASRRVSWNIDDLHGSCKARRMMELITDAEADGRKVIVFSFFLETIRKIQEYLGDRCLPPIKGSVPPHRRQEIIDEFDKSPAGSVLLAQIQAGGTGLNIQSASVVIICEPQLKPSIENQAISRAYRMGQARNVLVYHLLCENTIDERITDLLIDKQAIFNAFADKSVAASVTKEKEVELDEKTLGNIIESEIERINTKNAAVAS